MQLPAPRCQPKHQTDRSAGCFPKNRRASFHCQSEIRRIGHCNQQLVAQDGVLNRALFNRAVQPSLKFVHHHLGQIEQCRLLFRRKLRSGAGVRHAQRADGVAVRCHQRRSGIKPNSAITFHHNALGETRIEAGIGHHQHGRLLHHRVAHGEFAGHFRQADAELRLEPKPLAVGKTDQRRFGAADCSGQPHDPVEGGLRLGVEHIIPM